MNYEVFETYFFGLEEVTLINLGEKTEKTSNFTSSTHPTNDTPCVQIESTVSGTGSLCHYKFSMVSSTHQPTETEVFLEQYLLGQKNDPFASKTNN